MQLLSLIMTHKEARETVKRHLPIWERVCGKQSTYFLSPTDSQMYFPREIRIGEAEHSGEKSAQRIISIFNHVIDKYLFEEITHVLLMEYDSFAIAIPEDVIPDAGGVSAIRYKQNKPIKFKAKFYLHYPMLFTKEGFKRVAECLPEVKTNDRHFSDRFIGKAVELSGTPVRDLLKTKRGLSKNTIEPKHYPELKKAVAGGAVFFHGVKNSETLKIITNAT